jgi:hypothetical protein
MPTVHREDRVSRGKGAALCPVAIGDFAGLARRGVFDSDGQTKQLASDRLSCDRQFALQPQGCAQQHACDLPIPAL